MEVVYNGSINPIVLQIEHDRTSADFSDATRMRLHMDGTTRDSSDSSYSSYFDWDDGDGTVKFQLGLMNLPSRLYRLTLEVFYQNTVAGQIELDDLEVMIRNLTFTQTSYYCTIDDIRNMFGLLDSKIRIGASETDHISLELVDGFILKTQSFFDGKLKKIIGRDAIPFDSTNVPEEIKLATTFMASYLIYRTKFLGQMPEEDDPVNQWRREAIDVYHDFIENVYAGVTDWTAHTYTTYQDDSPRAYGQESEFFADIEDPVSGDLVEDITKYA